jgi:hypothetical protein
VSKCKRNKKKKKKKKKKEKKNSSPNFNVAFSSQMFSLGMLKIGRDRNIVCILPSSSVPPLSLAQMERESCYER